MSDRDEVGAMLLRMAQGRVSDLRPVLSSMGEAELPPEKRRTYSAELLGIHKASPAPVTPVDPDLEQADKLIGEVSACLEPDDLEKLRGSDRETRLLFARRLSNQRELKAEEDAAAAARATAAAEQAKAAERRRLSGLGNKLGQLERSK